MKYSKYLQMLRHNIILDTNLVIIEDWKVGLIINETHNVGTLNTIKF